MGTELRPSRSLAALGMTSSTQDDELYSASGLRDPVSDGHESLALYHEGTKDAKEHQATHPQIVRGRGNGASWSFVSFVPSW